jgi:outer membrane protein OmpA-like peptidoglycan-associated protein
VCGIKELCKDEKVVNEAPVSGNLLFYVSDDIPLVNEESYKLRDSLINELQSYPDSKIKIIGQFYSEEKNNTKYPDLGIARGNKVATLLFNTDSTLLTIESAIFEIDELNNQKLFRAVEFELLKINPLPSKFTIDKITIYFPYAMSDANLKESKLDSLKIFADEVKKSKSMLILSGHTDNKGTETYNLELGQMRAEWTKKLLLSYGVDSELVELESYGENKPVANNTSSKGRSKNRRVDITVKSNKN